MTGTAGETSAGRGAVGFVRDLVTSGKPVGVICHVAWLVGPTSCGAAP
jgi:putative intracellular protease/amidase